VAPRSRNPSPPTDRLRPSAANHRRDLRIIATIQIVIFVKMIVRALLRLPPAVTWSVSAKKMKTSASNCNVRSRPPVADVAALLLISPTPSTTTPTSLFLSSKWLLLPSCVWILMILRMMNQILL
jgi:hypothetical protein